MLTEISVPRPGLTPAALVVDAAALRPFLRERQAATEAANQMLPEVHERVFDAGFYRLLQPAEYGGYDFDLPTFARSMVEIAAGCASTGWGVAFTAGHIHVLGKYARRVQTEVYGPDGDCRAPLVEGQINAWAQPVDGGYVINGTFDNSSGIDVSTHFMGFVRVVGTGQPGLEQQLLVLLDRSQYEIDRNWDMLGMQGTGSHRTVVVDQFIAADRVVEPMAAMGGVTPIGERFLANPMHVGPSFNILMTEISSVAVGMGFGVLDAYEETLRKGVIPRGATKRIDDRGYQVYYGEAVALLETARAALVGGAGQYMEACERELTHPGTFDAETSWRLGVISQRCIKLADEATTIMFRTAGTSSMKPGTPMNRYFRDMSTLLTHITLFYDRWSERLTKLRFGLE
jgi:3-hydroxy-9,10-secoandrosta-1,3,5(10)-triene-9,17-dione monooxygenase